MVVTTRRQESSKFPTGGGPRVGSFVHLVFKVHIPESRGGLWCPRRECLVSGRPTKGIHSPEVEATPELRPLNDNLSGGSVVTLSQLRC